MPKRHLLCDLDNDTQRRALLTEIGALRGQWRVELTAYRRRRTDAQNRYYWGVEVALFYAFLRAQDYNITRPEHAHQLIAAKFLTVDVYGPTGVPIAQRIRSTTELSTAEFTDYIERSRVWLQDFFGIVVPDPTEIELPADFVFGETG